MVPHEPTRWRSSRRTLRVVNVGPITLNRLLVSRGSQVPSFPTIHLLEELATMSEVGVSEGGALTYLGLLIQGREVAGASMGQGEAQVGSLMHYRVN